MSKFDKPADPFDPVQEKSRKATKFEAWAAEAKKAGDGESAAHWDELARYNRRRAREIGGAR